MNPASFVDPLESATVGGRRMTAPDRSKAANGQEWA